MSTDVEAAGPVLTMPGAPAAFHVMAKPTPIERAFSGLDRVAVWHKWVATVGFDG